MKKNILLAIISLFVALSGSARVPLDSVLRVLDAESERASEYSDAHDATIAALRKRLPHVKDNAKRFELCHNIFELYRYFQYDSAYVYASKMLDIARRLNDPQRDAQARAAVMDCYTTAGLFKEASDMKQSIKPSLLPPECLLPYYELTARYYAELASFAPADSRERRMHNDSINAYKQLILSASEPNSFIFVNNTIDADAQHGLPVESMFRRRMDMLKDFKLDLHQQAVLHSQLGLNAAELGLKDEAAYHYAMAALADLRSSTRETTAAKCLAQNMYERGDIDRAARYIHFALSDANAYNTRLRLKEIGEILPRIELARHAQVMQQRKVLVSVLVVVGVLLLVIVVMFFKLRRRNRSLADSHTRLRTQAQELEDANSSLNSYIERLRETNEIKDQYIAQSLIGNTDFVNEVETKCKRAITKLKAKQLDDVATILHEMGIKRERERMFSSFDEAFLKLFPNFIDEFNKLFDADNQIKLGADGELSTELRIFALMRLGLDNPGEVANYLNLSVNTIYVYKTKVKARSILDKADFDQAVMNIPKP